MISFLENFKNNMKRFSFLPFLTKYFKRKVLVLNKNKNLFRHVFETMFCQFFMLSLIYFSSVAHVAHSDGDNQRQASQHKESIEVIRSVGDYTYLWKGLNKEESIGRLLYTPLNIAVTAIAYLGPSYYAVKAGALARRRPDWHTGLKASVLIAQGLRLSAFLWPILSSYWNDLEKYSWDGVAMDARSYWLCGRRRGILPVYSKSAWLSRTFHLEVVSSFSSPTVLKVVNLEKSFTSNDNEASSRLSPLDGWDHLNRAMTKHSVDVLFAQVDHQPNQQKVLTVSVQMPLSEKHFMIPLSNDDIPWDIEMLAHGCQGVSNRESIHSIFHRHTLNAIADAMDRELMSPGSKQSVFFPKAVDILEHSKRAITVNIGDRQLQQTLAMTDLSDSEHSGYIWLMDSSTEVSEISRIVNSRGGESVAQETSPQRVFDVSKTLSQLERFIAHWWVLPWMSSPLEEAINKQYQSNANEFENSYNSYGDGWGAGLVSESQHEKRQSVGAFEQGVSFLVDRVGPKIREVLYPIHQEILKRNAMFMIEYNDAQPAVPQRAEISNEVNERLEAQEAEEDQRQTELDFKAYLLTGSIPSTFYSRKEEIDEQVNKLLKKVDPEWAAVQLERFYNENKVMPAVFSKVINYLSLEESPKVALFVDRMWGALQSSAWMMPVVNGKKVLVGYGKKPEYKLKGWGRRNKRRINKYFDRLIETGKFPYDVNKYKTREGTSQIDIFRLTHFKPKKNRSQLNAIALVKGVESAREYFEGLEVVKVVEAFKKEKVMDEDKKKKGLVREANSDIKDIKKDLVLWDAIEKVGKKDVGVDVVVDLVKKHKLAREHVHDNKLTYPSVWLALLQHMPMEALMRNLGRMSALKMFEQEIYMEQDLPSKNVEKKGEQKPSLTHSESEKEEAKRIVLSRLQDQESIKRSRIHPLKILVSLKQYQQGRGERGGLKWIADSDIAKALEQAFLYSFSNSRPTGQRICFAVDISGSFDRTPAQANSVLSCLDASFGLLSPWVKGEMGQGMSPKVIVYDGQNAYDMSLDLVTRLKDTVTLLTELSKSEDRGDMELVYVIDGTGSMGEELDSVKESILTTTNEVNDSINGHLVNSGANSKLKVGLVVYRDHCDGNDRIVKQNLTFRYDQVLGVLEKEKAKGGGDQPEDVAGGLNEALNVGWSDEAVKLIVHVCDAPAHGKEFHLNGQGRNYVERDDYPAGDPNGLDPKYLMRCFAEKGISYCLFATDKQLEGMFYTFKQSYETDVGQYPNGMKTSVVFEHIKKDTVKTNIPKMVKQYAEQALEVNKEKLGQYTGTHGDQLFEPIDNCDGSCDNGYGSCDNGYGSCVSGILSAYQRHLVYDMFVIFTDGQDKGFSKIPDLMDQYRNKINKGARLVIVLLSSDPDPDGVQGLIEKKHILLWKGFDTNLQEVVHEWLSVDNRRGEIEAGIDDQEVMESMETSDLEEEDQL